MNISPRQQLLGFFVLLLTAHAAAGQSVQITSPATNSFTNSQSLHVAVSFARADPRKPRQSNVERVELWVNGVLLQTCDDPASKRRGACDFTLDVSQRPDQILHFVSRAYQATAPAGHFVSPEVLITLDRTAPAVTFITPKSGHLALNELRSPAIASFSDNLAGVDPSAVSMSLDQANVTAAAHTAGNEITFSPGADLSESEHTYEVRAVDRAGNAAKATVTFTTVVADAAAIIGSTGGTLRVEDGPFAGAKITFPPGALVSTSVVSATVVSDPLDPSNPEPVLELRPHDVTFAVPVTIALPSRSSLFESIVTARNSGGDWESVSSERCEGQLRCATATSFSFWDVRRAKLCHFRDASQGWKCAALEDITVSTFAPRLSPFVPVLLIHGFAPGAELELALDLPPPHLQLKLKLTCGYGSETYWGGMSELLRESDRDVWQLRYDTGWRHKLSGEALHYAIKAIKTVTAADGVALVAHSQGGLVARRYLQAFGAASVFRLITIGTPHKGTNFGSELAPRCDGIRDLRTDVVQEFNDNSIPPALGSSEPGYVFIGSRRFDFELLSPTCTNFSDDDWVVSLDSQKALRLDFPNAIRLTRDGYAHNNLFSLLNLDCLEQPQIPSTPENGLAIYQIVHEYTRILTNSGIVGSWRLDEGQGNTVADDSGNDYTGLLLGANWVNGGLTLNGGNNTVRFPSAPFELGSGTWVVTVRRSANSEGGWIVVKDNIGYRDDGILGLMADGRVYFDIHAAPSIVHRALSSEGIPPDTPVEILAQWGPGGIAVYVDGVLVATNAYQGPVLSPGRPLTLGNGIPGGIRSFDGDILDLKVYRVRKMP